MNNLSYANEFLKKLEQIIIKNDLKTIQKVKDTLFLISEDAAESIKLENVKTKTNEEIFMTEIELKQKPHSLFWTKSGEQKIIITLTKDT